MKLIQNTHALLRKEAARSMRESRRARQDDREVIAEWYEGRYTAYKQSAALLEIAIKHETWRAEYAISS